MSIVVEKHLQNDEGPDRTAGSNQSLVRDDNGDKGETHEPSLSDLVEDQLFDTMPKPAVGGQQN